MRQRPGAEKKGNSYIEVMEECRFEKFDKGLEELGVVLDDAQREQFLLYYKRLMEWNERMNLTAITDWEDVVTKHFLDSLCLVKAVPDLKGQRVLDLGTGAGFPGIPLKIAFPELSVVLMDSVGKKLLFLDALIGEMDLADVTTVHGRAEDLAHEQAYRQRFDLCVSRAVAKLAVLVEYGLPFIRIDGLFIAYKSGDVEEECAQAKTAAFLLGKTTEQVVTYTLPGTEEARSLVCFTKKEGSPRAYPRKAGTPARDPLS